jgi:protein-disulfide isomerase
MRYNTVNFLDGGEGGHSTVAGAVAMAIADSGNAEAFWAFHDWAFMNRTDISGYSFDDFADAAENLGVDADTVSAIRDESVRDTYQSVLESNMERLQDKEGEDSGTPSLYVNDEKFQLQKDPEMDTQTQMADWVPDVVG